MNCNVQLWTVLQKRWWVIIVGSKSCPWFWHQNSRKTARWCHPLMLVYTVNQSNYNRLLCVYYVNIYIYIYLCRCMKLYVIVMLLYVIVCNCVKLYVTYMYVKLCNCMYLNEWKYIWLYVNVCSCMSLYVIACNCM